MSFSNTVARLLGKAPEYCTAILVAAGSSTRMAGQDKLLSSFGGMTVLERSALALEQNELIKEIIVVTREELLEKVSLLLKARGIEKLTMVIPGGKTRAESVEAGLDHASKKTRLVAIHDAARPLVSQRVITEAIRKAAQTKAAAPAIPVKDTIKVAQQHIVMDTPDRSRLFAVQTPQVFDFDLLRAAYMKANADKIPLTDDCSAAEHLGLNVFLTQGDERNLKITTPMDLRIAKLLLEEEA
ncbi:MAG: 2-C-methyl-D-erythritol 4-phosphate cytidylyltransferase [Ruminococcaceae bacterium]|nr:2-C-methyl-D-erythritol 4-phosphate cytidylyltransferase [Oscillospiraceae bacterium]